MKLWIICHFVIGHRLKGGTAPAGCLCLPVVSFFFNFIAFLVTLLSDFEPEEILKHRLVLCGMCFFYWQSWQLFEVFVIHKQLHTHGSFFWIFGGQARLWTLFTLQCFPALDYPVITGALLFLTESKQGSGVRREAYVSDCGSKYGTTVFLYHQ